MGNLSVGGTRGVQQSGQKAPPPQKKKKKKKKKKKPELYLHVGLQCMCIKFLIMVCMFEVGIFNLLNMNLTSLMVVGTGRHEVVC